MTHSADAQKSDEKKKQETEKPNPNPTPNPTPNPNPTPEVTPGTQPPAVSTEGTELTAFLATIVPSKTLVTYPGETVTIPSSPPAGTSITVTFSHPELLEYHTDTASLRVKQLPAETTDVTVTVTATKNGVSKNRKFTVTVKKSGEVPTEEDYLKALTLPEAVTGDFPLPKELDNSHSSIAWRSDLESVIKINTTASNTMAAVFVDLVERNVKLTAEVSGKTKEFTVTVLPLVKSEDRFTNSSGTTYTTTYEFTKDTLTLKMLQNGEQYQGELYQYTVDADAKKITVKPVSVYDTDSKKWLEAASYYRKESERYSRLYNAVAMGLKKLTTQSVITLEDIKKAFSKLDGDGTTERFGLKGNESEEEVFEYTKGHLELDMTYDEFKALSSDAGTEKLKEAFEKKRKTVAGRAGLPADASIDATANYYIEHLRTYYEKAGKPRIQGYSISKALGKYQFEFR
jgi:drug resistance transporter, emrB/qacA subfamily